LVLFLDLSEAIEVHGWAGGPAHHHHALVSTPAELRAIAERWDFPGHAVTLRPDGQSHALILKDLFDWPTLEDAFAKALAAAASGRVFVESDLRAHANPTRMQLIGAAATDLAIRLRSRCPECRAPGFGREKRLDGLPCRECGTPTTETLGERWRCVRCSHHEDRRVNHGKTGDPAHCPFCNP